MAALNLKELEWDIEQLKQKGNTPDVYMLLGALYIIHDHLLGTVSLNPQISAYSEEAPPTTETVDQYGDSDFLRAVSGKSPAKVWPIIDDLMDALRVVNRRAYDNVILKLERLK